MDFAALKDKAITILQKYKYVLLILVAGIILMLIPSVESGNENMEPVAKQEVFETQTIHEELAQLLSMVNGAGNVRVMLTVAKGQQTVYQENIQETSVQTVIVTDSDRNENGLIKQINAPVYQGAIILCQGADDPSVRLSITEAVSKITGLGTNQIAVLKMK
jgi:stage III sporulation protein AG